MVNQSHLSMKYGLEKWRIKFIFTALFICWLSSSTVEGRILVIEVSDVAVVYRPFSSACCIQVQVRYHRADLCVLSFGGDGGSDNTARHQPQYHQCYSDKKSKI